MGPMGISRVPSIRRLPLGKDPNKRMLSKLSIIKLLVRQITQTNEIWSNDHVLIIIPSYLFHECWESNIKRPAFQMVFRVQNHHSAANFVGSPKSLVQIWPLSNWIHSFSINFLHGQNPHHPNIFNSTCHVGVHVHPQWQGGVTHGRCFSHLSQPEVDENHQKVCTVPAAPIEMFHHRQKTETLTFDMTQKFPSTNMNSSTQPSLLKSWMRSNSQGTHDVPIVHAPSATWHSWRSSCGPPKGLEIQSVLCQVEGTNDMYGTWAIIN